MGVCGSGGLIAMNAALFDLLPDFGAIAPKAAKAARNGAFAPPESVEPAVPEYDLGALIAEAVAEAETALALRLNEAHQAEISTLQAAHLAEKTTFLDTLGGDVGKAVATHMTEMEQRVATLTATVVARLLSGHLSEDLQRRSLEALAGTLSDAMRDDEAVRIQIRGPALLFGALQAALGALAGNLDFTEADGFDLTVTIDDVVFETRMAEWSTALSEVLA